MRKVRLAHQRKNSAPDDGAVIRLKLSVSFINQDASLAIADEGHRSDIANYR